MNDYPNYNLISIKHRQQESTYSRTPQNSTNQHNNFRPALIPTDLTKQRITQNPNNSSSCIHDHIRNITAPNRQNILHNLINQTHTEKRQHFLRQIPMSIQNPNINSKRAEDKYIIDHLRKIDPPIRDHGAFEWYQIKASYPMIDRVKRNCHFE